MRIIIITYDGSTTIDKCIERYQELGYDPEIFEGKSVVKDCIPFNEICFRNYTELLNLIDFDDDVCISEDDVYLTEKIEIEKKHKINWLGYWNTTKTRIMGSMLLYFPKDLLGHVSRQFNNKQACHLDYFIRKYFQYELRPTPITKELPHNSIILEQYTKGIKSIRTHKYMLNE